MARVIRTGPKKKRKLNQDSENNKAGYERYIRARLKFRGMRYERKFNADVKKAKLQKLVHEHKAEHNYQQAVKRTYARYILKDIFLDFLFGDDLASDVLIDENHN